MRSIHIGRRDFCQIPDDDGFAHTGLLVLV
jgi:hypothetical protein